MDEASDLKTAKGSRIYLDYASATPVMPEALETMIETMPIFGNPGSIHAEGVVATKILHGSRAKIAHELGAKAREVIFVSGGTEANNLAILGFAKAVQHMSDLASGLEHRSDLEHSQDPTFALSLTRTHWIVSSIEHPSVLECFAEIERLGGIVDFVDPDEKGIIRPEAVERLLKPTTIFVSIGWANGEIGVVQPLARISRVLREYEKAHGTQIIFHSDAGQAPLYESAHVGSLGVDILTLDSGKLYGPRGIGALYLNDRVSLAPLQLGGKQERGLRAGTENVTLATGFAAAYGAIARERSEEVKRLRQLRTTFINLITEWLPQAVLNGDSERSLPNIINISIPKIQSEYIALKLDHEGIAISTKSACREGEEQRSHVVEALGGGEWRAKNTLRFSFGRETSEADAQAAIEALARAVSAS